MDAPERIWAADMQTAVAPWAKAFWEKPKGPYANHYHEYTRADIAAARIAELTARAATAEARLEATEHVNGNLRDMLADAREALRPFADAYADALKRKATRSGAHIDPALVAAAHITSKHFDDACAALARIGQTPAQEGAK